MRVLYYYCNCELHYGLMYATKNNTKIILNYWKEASVTQLNDAGRIPKAVKIVSQKPHQKTGHSLSKVSTISFMQEMILRILILHKILSH